MALLLSYCPRNCEKSTPIQPRNEEAKKPKKIKRISLKINITSETSDLNDSKWRSIYTATVKVEFEEGEEKRHVVAEGKSPLDALKNALCDVFDLKRVKIAENLERMIGTDFWQYVAGFCKGVPF